MSQPSVGGAAERPVEPRTCYDFRFEGGEICPHCGEPRGPSGSEGGCWLHYPGDREAYERRIDQEKQTRVAEATRCLESLGYAVGVARPGEDAPPAVREAAEKLVSALDAVIPALDSQAVFMGIHGQEYRGPTFGIELQALREALRSSDADALTERQRCLADICHWCAEGNPVEVSSKGKVTHWSKGNRLRCFAESIWRRVRDYNGQSGGGPTPSREQPPHD